MFKFKMVFMFLYFLSAFLFPKISSAQGWVVKWEVNHGRFLRTLDFGNGDVKVAGIIKANFDGDGIPDILVHDWTHLIVHDGLTGVVKFNIRTRDLPGDNVLDSYPLVDDIDNDGLDEIVVSLNTRTIAYEYVGGGVGVSQPEQSNVPKTSELSQNYPNPFNPETNIEYSLKQSGQVQILIFNQLGQKVRTLVDEPKFQAGSYSVIWDGKDDNSKILASGTYYYQIRTDDFVSTKKAIFLK